MTPFIGKNQLNKAQRSELQQFIAIHWNEQVEHPKSLTEFAEFATSELGFLVTDRNIQVNSQKMGLRWFDNPSLGRAFTPLNKLEQRIINLENEVKKMKELLDSSCNSKSCSNSPELPSSAPEDLKSGSNDKPPITANYKHDFS